MRNLARAAVLAAVTGLALSCTPSYNSRAMDGCKLVSTETIKRQSGMQQIVKAVPISFVTNEQVRQYGCSYVGKTGSTVQPLKIGILVQFLPQGRGSRMFPAYYRQEQREFPAQAVRHHTGTTAQRVPYADELFFRTASEQSQPVNVVVRKGDLVVAVWGMTRDQDGLYSMASEALASCM